MEMSALRYYSIHIGYASDEYLIYFNFEIQRQTHFRLTSGIALEIYSTYLDTINAILSL